MDKEIKVEIKEEDDLAEFSAEIAELCEVQLDENVNVFEFKDDGPILVAEIQGEPPMPIVLHNCVTITDLQTPLDLATIHTHIRGAECEFKGFKAFTWRVHKHRATIRAFRSGKVMSFGANTISDSISSLKMFIGLLIKLEYKLPLDAIKARVCNMVATCDLQSPIRLEHLAAVCRKYASYEPEIFPGVVYRLDKPKIVLTIFANGKITMVGGKQREDFTDGIEIMYPILKGFFKSVQNNYF